MIRAIKGGISLASPKIILTKVFFALNDLIVILEYQEQDIQSNRKL
jgi:hypothetical protein